MYDLGDTVGLAVTLRDAAGALVNAQAVTLSITKPDGTLLDPAPSVTNPPDSTGLYVYDYIPAASGRFTARWAFTSPAAAFVDIFDVRPVTPEALVPLSEAKNHLNIPLTSTVDDEEIRSHIEAATAYIEHKVGPVMRRTYIDIVDPMWLDYDLATLHRQVLSVTSVTEIRSGTAWTAGQLADIDIDVYSGILRLKTSTWPTVPFRVVYVAGRVTIPANISLAARMLIAWSWETQRGVAFTPLSTAESATGLSPYLGPVPIRVDAMLIPSNDLSGFA